MHSFYPDAHFGLLQTVRAVHALMDTDHEVCIMPQHADQFAILRERFGADYTVTTKDAPSISVSINHSGPQTSIGNVQRPLIFSRSILSYCMTLWEPERSIRFSFAGLVTSSRREVLSHWLRESFPKVQINFPQERTNGVQRLWSRIKRRVGMRPELKATKRMLGEVVFWTSLRGRHFPIKSWDDEYFQLLGKSQFVLCPNGDYVWTYRFFEAAMCGAIPIIEQYCPAYEGFRFRTMEEAANDMTWSLEDAAHNYELCVKRLTVPIERLSSEIDKLLVTVE